MERNEMKICSLRNENLQFAKWQFTFSLRLLGYSKQKIPLKKPFRPENSDCVECVTFSLPCIKFDLSSGVFELRTATGSKTSFLFICLDATTFVLISIISLIETICLKICPRMQKVHFRCKVHTLIFHSWNAYWSIYKDKGANVSSTEK